MSGSPKYTWFGISQAVENMLRERRRRHAEAERARRAAEEASRKQERLREAQADAQRLLAEVERDLDDLAASDNARHAPAGAIDGLRARLALARPAIDSAGNQAAIKRLSTNLRKLREDIRQTAGEAEAARLVAQGLAEESATGARLRSRFTALDARASAKFDSAGRGEVEAGLKRLEAFLAGQALADARREAAALEGLLQKHVRAVEEGRAKWNEERDRAVAEIAEVSDRLAGLRADPVVMRWRSADLAVREQRARSMVTQTQAEQFAAASVEARAITAALDQVVAQAQEQQLKEERRQYVVDGICQVMQQMGFVLQAGSPGLEHPGQPASATVIHAERLGGGSLAISVPQEGDIWYDAGGAFPMRLEAGADGQPAATCDEAEDQIEAMHQALRESFGIETGELRWDGKNPTRIRRAADQLPNLTPSTRQREGQ
jgi:hypothetical protein